jgi:hypothetical protein
MNLSGAKKMTEYLGKFLVRNYDLKGHVGDETLERTWKEKEKFYDEMKEEQEKEVKEYGSVISY